MAAACGSIRGSINYSRRGDLTALPGSGTRSGIKKIVCGTLKLTRREKAPELKNRRTIDNRFRPDRSHELSPVADAFRNPGSRRANIERSGY